MTRPGLILLALVLACCSGSSAGPVCQSARVAVAAATAVESYACALQDAGEHQP